MTFIRNTASILYKQVINMATKILTGKKYFYAMGQSARDRGLNKSEAEELYTKGADPYARIYFDKGYRKLSM